MPRVCTAGMTGGAEAGHFFTVWKPTCLGDCRTQGPAVHMSRRSFREETTQTPASHMAYCDTFLEVRCQNEMGCGFVSTDGVELSRLEHAREEASGSESLVDVTRELIQSQDAAMVLFIRQLREDFTRMMMEYRAGVNEVLTKVTILREEFLHLHRYNPIEHVNSRIKTPKSILEKVIRKGLDPSIESIRESIKDIAGVRITCSFIADTYRVLEALTSQSDVRVIEIKDYITAPKQSGYKSLHAIIEIPVFLSTGPVPVVVEVQIRTIAMDFWASLEHKIFYKYDGDVPDNLIFELRNAAKVAEQLDEHMEELHREIHGDTTRSDDPAENGLEVDDALLKKIWELARASGQ